MRNKKKLSPLKFALTYKPSIDLDFFTALIILFNGIANASKYTFVRHMTKKQVLNEKKNKT